MNSLAPITATPETRVAIALTGRLAQLAVRLEGAAWDCRDFGRLSLEELATMRAQFAAVEAAALYLAGKAPEADPDRLVADLHAHRPTASAHQEAEQRALALAERLAAQAPISAADWLVLLLELVDRASSDSERLLERVFSALAERLAEGRWA